jgi:hypothetical protein
MRRSTAAMVVASGVLLTIPGAIVAQPRPPAAAPPKCFSARDWSGYKAVNDKMMFIRVRGRDIYRVEFAGGCPEVGWPDSHFVSVFRGTDEVCSPIDLDLKIVQGRSFPTPCMVSSITPVSYAEAAQIPRKLLP